MLSIPPQLGEASNGALFVMLGFLACYCVYYLFRQWQDGRSFFNDETKTVVALLTVSVGIGVKTFATWLALYLANHGYAKNQALIIPMFIASTLVAIWGVICLLRSLSRYEWKPYTWVLLSGSALAFGIVLAL